MTYQSEYNNVCEELDELALKMLVLMKRYIDLKLTVEELVKTGSLHLAKSRYIMGNKSVSVLQLPSEDSELNALTKVIEKKDDEDQISFEIARLNLSASPAKSSDDSDGSDGLKKRNVPSKNAQKTDENDENEKEDSGNRRAKRETSQDPLKWFGVLVPQNMRLAQSSFNSAIEAIIDVANVQVEMSAVQQKYEDLLSKKKSAKAKTNEVSAD